MGKFKWAVRFRVTETSTNKNAKESYNSDQSDSDGDIVGSDKLKEKKLKKSSSPFPTALHNVDGPNIS